ncbi:MAG: CinA family protein [Proteobacteria bacterium]|nr:CinA family protein [Pseudomonadota bacterium]
MAVVTTIFPPDLLAHATSLLALCRGAGLHIVTAESCTGGLIAALLTEIPGSSDVVERGMVVYSNDAKTAQLGVPAALIAAHGAVSEEVARAMADGALRHAAAELSIAVTGVAGPGGGTAAKPVGLVHLASARQGGVTRHERHVFAGDRAAVRLASVVSALAMLEAQARGR